MKKKLKGDAFIEHLLSIHYTFIDFFDKKQYEEAAVELNRYTEENDINELKTALIITQGFKDNPILKNARARVLEIFDKKMALLKKQK